MTPTTAPAGLICKIDTAGFASIMVVLMVVMIFGAALTPPHASYGADLPKIVHPKLVPHAMREDAMIVAIIRNGDIFFGNDRIETDFLADHIRQRLGQGTEKRVYIRADARCRYRNVEDVLDEIQLSGVEHVVFLVDQRKPQQ